MIEYQSLYPVFVTRIIQSSSINALSWRSNPSWR